MRSFFAIQPPGAPPPQATSPLPLFHPLTMLCTWFGPTDGFQLADALTGVSGFGATGSGKTSGPAAHLAVSYLALGLGGLVLCAKKEEREQWQRWAAIAKRENDLVIFDGSGKWRFNFLEWEAKRQGEGGGFTMNIVSLLDEIAGAIASGAGDVEGGGENKFFEDALHYMNTNLVELPVFAGLPLTLPLMRSIVSTAPQTTAQVDSEEWREKSICWAVVKRAEAAMEHADETVRADFEEWRLYWLQEWPALHEKTRSVINLSFSMLARPFLTRPLRELFSSKDNNIAPEDAFDGKIIIIDLPVQEYRLAGRVANLAWKYCYQIAVLRRKPPPTGYLRPVFLWADEAQNFISEFDAEYQAVARSAGGCTVYLTQNRESYRRVLNNDDAVDSLLGNLQAKFFCQNTGGTNEWAARLLGEAWIQSYGSSIGHQARDEGGGTPSAGVNITEQRRYLVEPSRFTTLKRGGPKNNFAVECIVYNGGAIFPNGQPYTLLTFEQR